MHLLLCVYIVTFLMGVPANVLAFCTFCRKVYRKPTPIDILLLNLTVSDLIFLTILPFKMQEASDNMSWLLPYALCPLTGFLFYVTIYNSTLLLTAVSVERYLGVAFPLRYSLYRRPRYAVLASFLFWVVTCLNLSIVYIMPYSQWSKGTNDGVNGSRHASAPPTCYLNFTEDELRIVLPVRLELFCVLFCIPFFICSFCYVNFILILSRLPNIGRRRKLRAIGLALGTLIVFAVCFGPYNASHVVGFARKESQEWRNVALLSSTFNACLDPIIFYFSSAAVRSMLNHCFKNIMAKMHILQLPRSSSGPPTKSPRVPQGPPPTPPEFLRAPHQVPQSSSGPPTNSPGVPQGPPPSPPECLRAPHQLPRSSSGPPTKSPRVPQGPPPSPPEFLRAPHQVPQSSSGPPTNSPGVPQGPPPSPPEFLRAPHQLPRSSSGPPTKSPRVPQGPPPTPPEFLRAPHQVPQSASGPPTNSPGVPQGPPPSPPEFLRAPHQLPRSSSGPPTKSPRVPQGPPPSPPSPRDTRERPRLKSCDNIQTYVL